MRIGEVLKLRVSDVSGRKLLIQEPKSGREAEIAFMPRFEGIRLGQTWLKVGDPVIVTENNYDLGLFNGTTGFMVDIEEHNGQVCGLFEFEGYDGHISLSMDELFEVGMKLAYAISIHKAQGSEYDADIVSCEVDSDMIEKSLMYTALTRAKQLCFVVGSQDIFQSAIAKPARADSLCCGFFC
jgi:exodeoxyribonuclease V alpha subunit